MLEEEKMHTERVLRRIIEEENKYGNGFRIQVSVDQGSPLNKYVSFDVMWLCGGEDTEDSVGVLLSPNAAYEIARMLEEAASTTERNRGDFIG